VSILDRFARAARGAFKGWATGDDVLHATVRETDQVTEGRYVQLPYAEMVRRYSGYVKVAVSRNGAAVGGLVVRVYRRKRRGDGRSVWKSRSVPDRERVKVLRAACEHVSRAFEADDDMEEVTDPLHPLVSLMRQPNPRESGFEMIEAASFALDLVGNAYQCAVKGRTVAWPTELWSFQPQYVRALPDRERWIRGYSYGTSEENAQEFDAAQVIHTKSPNPLGDPYYGMGCLAAAVVQADLMTAFSQHALASLDNGAQPGLIINIPGAAPKMRQAAENELNRKARGVSKAARTLVLGLTKDSTIKDWAPSTREISFLQSARDVREVIANVFDLPVVLLTMDTAALAQAAAGIPFWHEMGIIPRKKRIEGSLNAKLVPMFAELGEDLYICLDPPVGDKRAEEVQEAVTLKNAGIIKASAAAARLGEDPEDVPVDTLTLDAEGDTGEAMPAETFDPARASGVVEVLKSVKAGAIEPEAASIALVTLYSVPKPDADAMVNAQEPEEAPDAGEVDPATGEAPTEDDAEEPPQASRSIAATFFAHDAKCCDGHGHVTRDDKKTGPDDIKIDATESALKAALRRWFTHVAPIVQDGVNFETGDVENRLSGSEAATAAYNEVTGRKLAEITVTGWNRGSSDTEPHGGDVPKIAGLNQGAVDLLNRRGARVVDSIGEALTERVRGTLAQGIENGETQPQLIERVRAETSGVSSEYAAERIARTETARAFSVARRDAWKESGIVKARRWLLSGEPCPLCLELSKRFTEADLSTPLIAKGGSITDADGTSYTFDWDSLEGPPGHPGCQCDEAMVLKDDA